MRVLFLFLILLFLVLPVPLNSCISDPSVTVVYNLNVDMDLLKILEYEGFSFQVVSNVIPTFDQIEREFVVYKAHYGFATAMVAYDIVAIKAHEEKYNWEKGIRTELTFLRAIGVLGYTDIDAVSELSSWESTSGKNLFSIPDPVEFISFGSEIYPVSQPMMTDYFSFSRGWIAVPGNATVSVEGNTLSVILMRCGGELSADTSKLSIFAPLRGAVLVCNSIDYEVTGKELTSLLEERGFTVIRITPDQFDTWRWFSPRIIFLGGHKSPEGMGEIVNELLSDSEKKMIEKTGPIMFAYDDVDFRRQSMIFLAGKDREGTREIALARIDDIVMWLEFY